MHMVTHQKRHGAPESSDRSPNRSMSESYSVQGSSSALLHGNESNKSLALKIPAEFPAKRLFKIFMDTNSDFLFFDTSDFNYTAIDAGSTPKIFDI